MATYSGVEKYFTPLDLSPQTYTGVEKNFTPLVATPTYTGDEKYFTPAAVENELSFTTGPDTPVRPWELDWPHVWGELLGLSQVVVDSIGYTILKDSLSIETRIEERSTASFTVIDLDNAFEFLEGFPVELYDENNVRLFGGQVDSVKSYRVGDGRYHDISCADYHYLADKRRAAVSYTDKTAGYIVADLWNTYLVPEEVLSGEIQEGPLIKEMVVNYARVSDALDVLAEKAGFIWYIDENKALYFIDRATNAAPWTFTNLKAVNTPTLTNGNPQYRNRQYVIGTSITEEQVEVFTGDGETKSFTVGYPIALAPTITIGELPASVGIKGVDVAMDFYWAKGDSVITSDIAPDAGLVVQVLYQGTYPVVVLSSDAAAILGKVDVERGGTGYVEDIADDAGTTSVDAAWELAASRLQKYCRDARRFDYQTEDSGLFPGQLQHVTYPLQGLDQDMLIESVSIHKDSNVFVYDVTCIEGPEMGSWSKFFKTLADQAKTIMDRINVGLGDTVVILAQTDEIEGWTEDHTEIVYACPVCGPATVCGPTVYVC